MQGRRGGRPAPPPRSAADWRTVPRSDGWGAEPAAPSPLQGEIFFGSTALNRIRTRVLNLIAVALLSVVSAAVIGAEFPLMLDSYASHE